ncbi:MAG TPA: HAMP domain-containing sensor histidine kinase [Gammaproteobacteria bacterium]|nr:HAMP domain-containing sensor histidine kinase [Gammaproteobacteria bacterium]
MSIFNRQVHSLAGKMLLTILAVHALLIPLIFTSWISVIKSNYEDHFVDQVRSDAQWLTAFLRGIPDKSDVRELVDDLVLGGFRQSILVYDLNYAIIAGAGFQPDLPFNRAREDFYFGQHDDARYWISAPLYDRNNVLFGSMQLAYDETPVKNEIHALYRRGIAFAGAYLWLVIVSVAILGNRLSRSLRRVSTAAHRVASGDYNIRFQPEDNTTEIISLSEDLERMRSELVNRGHKLAEREMRIRAVVDHVADGVLTLDGDGRVIAANPAALRIFNTSVEDITGTVFADWLANIHGIYDLERLSGQGPVESLVCTGDGSFLPVELALSQLQQQQQNLYLVVARDISERKRIEEERKHQHDELAHMHRLSSLGEMAAGLAHELNQPLAAINLYIQGCLKRLTENADQLDEIRAAMNSASLQAQRAGDIVAQIRGFVRKADLDRHLVDINQLIRDTLHLFDADPAMHRTHLKLELADDLPQWQVDPLQIQQVLVNLVSNANNAMTDDATPERLIIIRTEREGDTVIISVEDRGEGIPAGLAERIFEPFVTRRSNGLGLGLSISRSIVEEHGGVLCCHARPAGGTVFSFALSPDDQG